MADARELDPRAKPLTERWTHPVLGELSSRIAMTAMTRSFAAPGNLATPQMAEYYARRARLGVGLLLTESTAPFPEADGFPRAPRMHTKEQIASWRLVTDAVHAAGAPIFSQLLHCGRISHEDYTDGIQPVSSTDRQAAGINRRNNKPWAIPRRLEPRDMPPIYEGFRRSVAGALEAGFDGVELHLAHGYLADQFLDSRVNDRTDRYGGSIENRCRFALELTETVLRDCGSKRVMVRISPSRWMGGLYDWPDLEPMIEYVVPAFDAIGVRLLDVSCARSEYFQTSGRIVRSVRKLWPHFLMAGASLSRDDAQRELDSGLLDMVTYGRLLIANPDLVVRFREGAEIRPYDEALLESLE
jgi:N-ethylmaleimide reductase